MRAILIFAALAIVFVARAGDAEVGKRSLDQIRKEKVEALRRLLDVQQRQESEGLGLAGSHQWALLEARNLWSRRLMDAEAEMAGAADARLAAARGHLDRMKRLEQSVDALRKAAEANTIDGLAALYYRLEAEELLHAADRR